MVAYSSSAEAPAAAPLYGLLGYAAWSAHAIHLLPSDAENCQREQKTNILNNNQVFFIISMAIYFFIYQSKYLNDFC